MELKWRNGTSRPIRSMSFNRTFMELKSRCFRVVFRIKRCFNRTFMELKLIRGSKPVVVTLF